MSPHNLVYKPVRKYGPYTVYEVDTKKTTFFGLPFSSLGAFGRRKLDNLLMLTHHAEQTKFIYD